MKKPDGIKGVSIEYKKLKDTGFDFSAFEYMANLIYNEGNKTIILKNAKILDNKAIIVNKDLTTVFLVDLSLNPNVKVEKIDRSKIN